VVDPATTWAFVTMWPCVSTMTPDPRPLSVWITTTDGLTWSITATNWSSRVVVGSPPALTAVGDASEAGTADSPPPHDVRANAAIAPASKYRRAAIDDRLTSQSPTSTEGAGVCFPVRVPLDQPSHSDGWRRQSRRAL